MTLYKCSNHDVDYYCDECSPPDMRENDIAVGRKHYELFDNRVSVRMSKRMARLVLARLQPYQHGEETSRLIADLKSQL